MTVSHEVGTGHLRKNERVDIIVLGAGGHARSVADALGRKPTAVAIVQPTLGETSDIAPLVIAESAVAAYAPSRVELVNGIGQTAPGGPRSHVFQRFSAAGFNFPPIIHPWAFISESASLSPGVQALAGVVVGPRSTIGANTTINTGAIVEHDCTIGDNVHIAPGAVLCGGVTVEAGSVIGAGATVIPGCTIGTMAQVGAGATVVGDIPARVLAVGTPARVVRDLPG